MAGGSESRDFFISFNRADKEWATWIAWVLEAAGYKVIFQHWDIVPGSNFIAEMQRAVIHARQTVLVLSDAALRSDFVTAEWAAAMSADPSGAKRKLIPVRVKPLTVPRGLLGQIVYVDLVGLSQADARHALLGSLRKRRKPSSKPTFPDLDYPGPQKAEVDLSDRLRESLRELADSKDKTKSTPATDRRTLSENLGGLGVRDFNILLETLDVPSGAVPPMPAAQGDRILAFVDWADGDQPGLGVVAHLVEELRQIPTASIPLDQWKPNRLASSAIASCEGVLEDIDELGRAYIEVEQWPKAFLTYRTLIDLAAERETRVYARGLARLGEVHWLYGEPANAERSWDLSRAVYRSLAGNAEAAAEAATMAKQEKELRAKPATVAEVAAG